MKPTSSQRIVNLTRRGLVCEQAVIADQPLRRMRGLLGRRALPAGEGILLQPAPSIHTAFMRFPIDVVFLDANLGVVKLVERLPPWRTAAARHARATLELAAGEVAARGIRIGDRLGLASAADNVDHLGRSLKIARRSADPMDVLLLGNDRRFCLVTAALLTRRGCNVTLGGSTVAAAELAKTDVVVIDAASSATVAGHEATRIQTLGPRVGVVIVGEKHQADESSTAIVPKSSPFDDLFGAIERARPRRDRKTSDAGS